MTQPTTVQRRADLADSLLSRLAWRIAVAAADRVRVGRLVVVLPDGAPSDVRRRSGGTHRGDPHPRPEGARQAARRRRDRWRRGVHGRPVVQPRPRRPPPLGRSQPRSWRCRPAGFAARSTPADDRAPAPAQHARGRAVGTSRPTTTSATTSIGLFLDETMTYSSAVFDSPEQSLADAQRNKYRRIAERAGLRRRRARPGDRMRLGRLRAVAAGELGCRVTSITISQEQHDLARERVARGRRRRPRGHPVARLPRHRGQVRQDRLGRDARGRRGGVLHDVLRGATPALVPGGR